MNPKAWMIIDILALVIGSVILMIVTFGIYFELSKSFFFIHKLDIVRILSTLAWLFLHFFGDGLGPIEQPFFKDPREFHSSLGSMDQKAQKFIDIFKLVTNILLCVLFIVFFGDYFRLSRSFVLIHAFEIIGIHSILTWVFLYLNEVILLSLVPLRSCKRAEEVQGESYTRFQKEHPEAKPMRTKQCRTTTILMRFVENKQQQDYTSVRLKI